MFVTKADVSHLGQQSRLNRTHIIVATPIQETRNGLASDILLRPLFHYDYGDEVSKLRGLTHAYYAVNTRNAVGRISEEVRHRYLTY